MRKLIALLVLALIVFLVVFRQRIFVRDVLSSVTRDGAPVSGVQVYINYANDVLLQDDSAGKKRIYMVQNWHQVAEAPTVPLNCIQWVACMSDADHATGDPIPVGRRRGRDAFHGVLMTPREVDFVDEDGALVQVMLR
jgi:hypothetical protein